MARRARIFPRNGLAILILGVGVYPGATRAQVLGPSVYLGFGTGTNVGGTIGVGAEVPVSPLLSVSAAVGLWPEALHEAAFASRAFDFDFGVKVYPRVPWFFVGVNYGIIQAEIVSAMLDDVRSMRKRRGLTFSLGARALIFRRIYTSGFVGVTSDGEANHIKVFDRRSFIPHFGLMVGYDLSPSPRL